MVIQRKCIAALMLLLLPFVVTAGHQRLAMPGMRGKVISTPEAPPVNPPAIVSDKAATTKHIVPKATKATLYSIGDPTAKEQLILEYMNRSRADANAEAERLKNTTNINVVAAYSFFNVDLDQMVSQYQSLEQNLPPLSMNSNLLALARLHTQDMYQNVFQGHTSSASPPSPLQANSDLTTRFSTIGYDFSYASENVYAYSYSAFYSHAAFEVDWGSGGTYGMQEPPGHRNNIHHTNIWEVGIGVVEGTNSNGSDSVGPMLVTQNFAKHQSQTPYITGVVYTDSNTNQFYDEGEGMGGVTITVQNASYYAVSATAGGYSVPVSSDGTYTVTFTGSSFTSSVSASVANFMNVKIDYVISGSNTAGSAVVVSTNATDTTTSTNTTTSTDSTEAAQDDLAVYDSTTGAWYIYSLDGTVVSWATGWGWPGADTVPGDYNGDGLSDLAVFDQASGGWYIYSLDGATLAWGTAWGWSGAIPVSGDYNGDGVDDLAVYDSNTGSWYIYSLDGAVIAWAIGWGWPGAETVSGDYNGDGVSDLAVFDQNTGAWYVYSHDGTIIVWGTAWGWPGAVPVSGDYNGDSNDDLAVYDSNTGAWYIYSLDGSILAWEVTWGWPGAETVSGDYNGDGVSDLAVFDQNTGGWYIYSLDGTVIAWAVSWGWPGAVPVAGNYQ
ncbi:hypothetical protein BVX94_01760 [bacterium B17]|nr:hypothetical protein BVX94_01760 [bacterium B17]